MLQFLIQQNIMKTILKYMTIAASAVALYGCQDDHYDINTNSLPSVSDINVEYQLLEENKVKFTLLNQGCNPIWDFGNGVPNTINGVIYQFPIAGDYIVKVKMYNQNGVTDGAKEIALSFTESFKFTDEEVKILTTVKNWCFAWEESGHLACGENADNPTGWWAAGPEEKKDNSIYNDKITFEDGGVYKYDPVDGKTFANKGVTVFPGSDGENDFDAETSAIEKKWRLEYEGDNLYLFLDPESIIGYIASDDEYKAPKYQVKEISDKKLVLLNNLPGITWQYILKPYEEYTAKDPNLINFDETKYEISYRPGWNDRSDKAKVTFEDGVYTLSLPEATEKAFQAQLSLLPGLKLSANQNYRINVKLKANQNLNGATFKLEEATDNTIALLDLKKSINLVANEEYEISELVKGQDVEDLQLRFDFGGNGKDFNVEIYEISLEPSSEFVSDKWEANPEGDITSLVASNWAFANYHGAGDWSAMNDFVVNENTPNDNDFTIHYDNGTGERWKAQFRIISQYLTEANQSYDFKVKVKSSKAIASALVQLSSTDEGIKFFTEEFALPANEEVEFVLKGFSAEEAMQITTRMTNDGSAVEKLDNGEDQTGGLTILFDFGGNPEDCTIEITDIAIQKSK